MKRKITKLAIKFSVFLLASIVVFAIRPKTKNSGSTDDVELKENIVKAVQDMESIMDKSYSQAETEMSDLTTKNNYDYELTAEYFYNQGKPFSSYDYREFVAAYTTIQDYCIQNNIDMGDGINEINFISMSYNEENESEYVPLKIDTYTKTDKGYEKDGYAYITEPCDVKKYVETKTKGIYKIDGVTHIKLEKENTPYAEITLSSIPIEKVYETFGLNRDDFKEEEAERLKKINEAMGDADVGQNIFISESSFITQEQQDVVNNALSQDISDTRKTFINIASSIVGKVPYEFGGKSSKAGIDTSWYTFDSTGRQKGLDCSGFVQWVLRTSGFDGWESLTSTSDFLSSDKLEIISGQDLEPGDVGLFYPSGTDKINHIGIYLGNGYWIHCSSAANTVTISDNMAFSIYRRFRGIDDGTVDLSNSSTVLASANDEKQEAENVQKAKDKKLEQNNIILMAKIVQCEAYGEGYNGWVGVAQVIRDRILSDSFKADNIKDVVSAPGQFSTYDKACSMDDSDVDKKIIEVCSKVMDGDLKLFDSDNVIAFKRNDGSTEWNGWSLYKVVGNHAFYQK